MKSASRNVSSMVILLLSLFLLYELVFSHKVGSNIEQGEDRQIIDVLPENDPPPIPSRTWSSPIEIVVITPYRTASVAPQVGGVILRFNFDEGDYVQEGQIVCEIDSTKYQMALDRAKDRVNELRVAFKRAKEEAQIKQELFDLDITTLLEVAKTDAEFEMAKFRLGAAEKELELAQFDFDACKVKAPFSGYMSARQKQPDESVDKLQPMFTIVDSSKVYAVPHVPVSALSRLQKGAEAYFVYGNGNQVKGVVDRVGKLIDPKSKTKRVYLLIDNSAGNLEVGMTGALQTIN